MTASEAMKRYPRIVAHVICHSLGYASPTLAADIVAKAHERKREYCEWIYCCYGGDPLPAVRQAISGRHRHRGYMADYRHAIALVWASLANQGEPMLASWFQVVTASDRVVSPEDWYVGLPEWEKVAVLIVFGGNRKAAFDAHQRFEAHFRRKQGGEPNE